MSFYGFEYFSGANVIIKTNGHACLEAAAISYSSLDSKRPIYGYSSVYYDAVAPGQKIIQGSLVVNYVYDNYLFDCIKKGIRTPPPPTMDSSAGANSPNTIDELVNQYYTVPNGVTSGTGQTPSQELGFDGQAQQVLSGNTDTSSLDAQLAELQKQYWGPGGSNEDIANFGRGNSKTVYGEPLNFGGGVQISIDFGNRGEKLIIDGVNFIGRGSTIQIDENVIVEEYNFFARRLRGSLTTPF